MPYTHDIPPEQLVHNASNDMLVFTAVLAIFIGIALGVLGYRGRQYWLLSWSVGLVFSSIALGGALVLF